MDKYKLFSDTSGASILQTLRESSLRSRCVCGGLTVVVILSSLGFGLIVHMVDWNYAYINGNLQNYSSITASLSEEMNYMMRHSCEPSSLSMNGTGRQVALIKTKSLGTIPVLCDTQTDGGNWIIIQRRVLGNVPFYTAPNYQFYDGIGTVSLYNDFWLGLHKIESLCKDMTSQCELRIDMKFVGTPASHEINETTDHMYHVHYDHFYHKTTHHTYHSMFGRWHLFKQMEIFVSNPSGNAGDALSNLIGGDFAVFKYHPRCSMTGGAWWFRTSNICGSNKISNLNGQWAGTEGRGILWGPLTGPYGTLATVEMKIRFKKTA